MTWQSAKESLQEFGGSPTTLYIRKTGLPFFDALRLYGAIDVFFRLSGETRITDEGAHWRVDGIERAMNSERLSQLIDRIRSGITPKPKGNVIAIAAQVREYLQSPNVTPSASCRTSHEGVGIFSGLDSVLQTGMRGTAASSYETLQSGNTSAKECRAEIRFVDGLLAVGGAIRTDTIGDLVFLPIFEGTVDFSKIVAPLRAWLGVPVPLCAQALVLLALETALFAEGYQMRLSAIVYNRRVSRGDFAYSGILSVQRTALAQSPEQPALSSSTISHLYASFRTICGLGWNRGKTTEFAHDAMGMARWIVHPKVHKHLRSLITSQERLKKYGFGKLFNASGTVEEIFQMTHGTEAQIDHEACRKFAKAVASGIYQARMKESKDPKKEWYDEVTLLRSATRARQFFQRAMILIEQGRKESSWVGSSIAGEDFSPLKLEEYYRRSDTREFEIFRDLFRMYLVQESGGRSVLTANDAEAILEQQDEHSTTQTEEPLE
jgi:hypothetical protein